MSTLRAFEGFGLELEYMLVGRDSLDVAPVAESALERRRAPTWSNELVAHVVELKNPQPTPDLATLSRAFHAEVRAMNAALAPLGARLMPAGMHPWMDPRAETRLWPRDDDGIYRTYDRIFGCRSHGWANVQSTHINLPFADDGEFARLHAAVRLALPILPAIAASSPYAEGRAAGPLDYRLHVYRDNAGAVPEMNGELVPEPIASRRQYERELLEPLYRALAPRDPEGRLRHEWANARGAIARFDRSALEIRVLDVQEHPAADVAIAAAIIDLVAALYEREPPQLPTGELARILDACIRDADRALIDSPRYVEALAGSPGVCTAGELWARLVERLAAARHREIWEPTLRAILEHGPLARRLLAVLGGAPSRDSLRHVYENLCECLEQGVAFGA